MKRVFLCSQSWWDGNVVNILTIIIMDLIDWSCWIALAPGEEGWAPRCPSCPWWLAEWMVAPHTPGIQISTTTIGIVMAEDQNSSNYQSLKKLPECPATPRCHWNQVEYQPKAKRLFSQASFETPTHHTGTKSVLIFHRNTLNSSLIHTDTLV